MSNISDRHSFAAYVSTGKDKSVALSGQRLAVIRFKKDKDGNKARESQCVSVPVTKLETTDYEFLAVHIQDWFAGVQDEVIREKCVAGDDAVTSEQISVESIRNYLIAQSQGERLNGEQIGYWFDQELADLLTLAFAEKLSITDNPTEEQTKKLAQMTKVYRDCFSAMAGGRTMFDTVKRDKLLKAISLVDCTEGIGAKLQTKLNAMKEVSVEEMLGL